MCATYTLLDLVIERGYFPRVCVDIGLEQRCDSATPLFNLVHDFVTPLPIRRSYKFVTAPPPPALYILTFGTVLFVVLNCIGIGFAM